MTLERGNRFENAVNKVREACERWEKFAASQGLAVSDGYYQVPRSNKP